MLSDGAALERGYQGRAADVQAQLDSILVFSRKLYCALKIVKNSKPLGLISGEDIRVDAHPNILEDDKECSRDSSSSSE